jgi:serine protease inhibitor
MPDKRCLKTYALLIGLLFLVIALGGCTLFEPKESLAAPVEELDQRIVDANNGLGFNLFIELAEAEPGENIFISPSSILTALAMTYNGADGETRAAMEEALSLQGMTMEDVNDAISDLLTILENPDPKVELAVANSLWSRRGVDFKEDFLQRNIDYYKAEISELNFNDPGAADHINQWVREHTRDKIDGIIEPPINPEAILFLINAIYFKGEWSEPFDPEMTRSLPFHPYEGTAAERPVMFRNDHFQYMENNLFQAVNLPYGKNERISMYLFLPAEEVSLEEFYAEMDPAAWDRWIDAFGGMEGVLGLPRFQFEYKATLNEALEALGMGIAFDRESADFSAMHPIPPRLYLSEVKHKTFIEVNEEGTEAAAVTSVEVGVTAMPEIFTMIIDRPFFFAIADNLTGTILFMGSVLQL